MPIQIRVVIPNASFSDTTASSPDEANEKVARKVRSIRKTKKGAARPKSAPVPGHTSIQTADRPHKIVLNVASIYDVENEHDYIMAQAVQAYVQHRNGEKNDQAQNVSPRQNKNNNQTNLSGSRHPPKHHRRSRRFLLPRKNCRNRMLPSSSSSSSSLASLMSNSADSPESKRMVFKLALCTLKDVNGNDPLPVPHTHSKPGPGYLPLQRPWSASPTHRLKALKAVSLKVEDSRVRNTEPCHQQKVHVNTLILPDRMDSPISRSTAYHIRNRTTHSWSEDSNSFLDPMTMSCPSARSLEEHMRSVRTCVPRDPNPSPVIVKGRAVMSPSSPQTPRERPSSAYSYDGGLFLSANSCNKDYFVIHPDWVSEAMTVQKLSLNERQGRAHARTLGPTSGGRSFAAERGKDPDETDSIGRRARRCKSAPPTKYRNPITWSI